MPPIKRKGTGVKWYRVIARPTDQQSQAVGPHTLYKIRLWVAEKIVSPDVQICKEGDTARIKAKDLPGFYDFPAQLRIRLEREKARIIDPWESKPATDRQICYLRFMRVPFNRRGLTRYRAQKLIDGFTEIDPRCYPTSLNCPPTPEIIEELKSLGETDIDIEDLNLCDAKDRIDELKEQKEEERKEAEEDAFEDFACDMSLWFFSVEDWLEESGQAEDFRVRQRELKETELRQFKAYLDQNVKNWEDEDVEHIHQLIPKVFPQLLAPKAKRGQQAQQTGCLLLIGVVLIAIVKSFWG
jgi:hypothetical protein